MFKKRFFNILVAVALLAVLLLTVQGVVATKSVVSDVESASRMLYATNPELMVAARYNVERIASTESNQLAASPELSSVHRYSDNISGVNNSLATNPELSVANRYIAYPSQIKQSIFLSKNPELSVAWRYTAMRTEK